MSKTKTSGTYDTLSGLQEKLTRINGVINTEAIKKLEDDLGGIFTVVKTHHYEQGQKYGHLESAIPQREYQLVIGNPT